RLIRSGIQSFRVDFRVAHSMPCHVVSFSRSEHAGRDDGKRMGIKSALATALAMRFRLRPDPIPSSDVMVLRTGAKSTAAQGPGGSILKGLLWLPTGSFIASAGVEC